jgi:ADP-ribose pyrophosphatase YjhB (NUDIX family)
MRQMETTLLRRSLAALIDVYAARWPGESEVVTRFREFLSSGEILQGKTNLTRHITASTWIVDAAHVNTLLTHHAKLNKWVQLGGHTDEGEPWAEAALREAREESGLSKLRFVDDGLFDLDIHEIPARPDTPAHWHYDLRFLVEADPAEALVISEESRDLAWVPMSRLGDYTEEESQHRMAKKTPR